MWQVVASYFPVGQCLEALKILSSSLFGATFEQVPLAPGEAWHPDVQKLTLRHASEVHIKLMRNVYLNKQFQFHQRCFW